MQYEFITCDDGEIRVAEFPMSKAPDIGARVMIEGVECMRIISNPAAVRVDNWKPYASERLPRNLMGCKHDKKGRPIIETRAQERGVMARCGYERE